MKVPFVNIGLQYKFLKDEIISKVVELVEKKAEEIEENN